MSSYAKIQESGLDTGMKTLGLSGTSGWGKICLYEVDKDVSNYDIKTRNCLRGY